MSEKISSFDFEQLSSIEVGSLVVLRKDLDECVLEALDPQILPDTEYKVYYISADEDTGEVIAYIAPQSSEVLLDIEDLEPKELFDIVPGLRPVSKKHLTRTFIRN